jgi:hypothetical protein
MLPFEDGVMKSFDATLTPGILIFLVRSTPHELSAGSSNEAGWTPTGNFLCENPCEKMFPKSAKMSKNWIKSVKEKYNHFSCFHCF